jgi:Kdo2-lipid IVA lauroyltransferase/acyltransferase
MNSKKFKWRWVLPQYYPLWLIFAVLYAITKWIPFSKPLIASCIGHLLWVFSKKIKRTVLTNIKICLPQSIHEDELALAKKVFIRYGHSILEIGQAWFASNDQINKLFIVEGENYLAEARLSNKPILLGTAHFTCLELGLAKASTLFDRYAGLYRPSKNDLIEYVMYKARIRRGCSMIPHSSIKELIKKLKQKFVAVYLPDQPELTAPTDLLNFFSNPCVTNLALSKIARISGAIIRLKKPMNHQMMSGMTHKNYSIYLRTTSSCIRSSTYGVIRNSRDAHFALSSTINVIALHDITISLIRPFYRR